MIKLIASDMDGTLLNDSKQIPGDFFGVIDELEKRGVFFAVSSGRTYLALDHLFPEEYRDRIDFICDNGACVMHKGKPVSVTPLDRETYEELLSACERIGGLKILVCAESGTYHKKDTGTFTAEIQKYYRRHIETDDFLSIHETIYKLAVCDMQGTMNRGKPELDKIFGDRLNVQVSGPIWMDVMASGVSKGKALMALQQALGVTREETMAFGDYFNDVEMLNAAEWSFCMENGHEDVKKICRFIAPGNNECGVTRSIRKYIFGEDIS